MVKNIFKKIALISVLSLSSMFVGCGGDKVDNVVPPVTISGADSVIPNNGDMVVLRVVKPEKTPDGLHSVKYDWKVFDQNHKEKTNVFTEENGECIYFGSGISPTKYLVVLDVVYEFWNHGKIVKTSGIVSREVIIGGGPGPNPSPSPTPTPVPTPSVPDGKYGLTKLSYQTAMAKVKGDKAKSAKALSDNYASVATRLAAGAIKTLDDAFEEIRKGNLAALEKSGASKSDWEGWDEVLRKSIYKLYSDDKLKVLSDYPDVFKAISDGLAFVK